ncbi:hypothetical protein K443DRAFT_149932 [Laccaria amethystina LaAM-08-1]|uniref:Uncharacterized protein n=1 Tax=Laccaria amethystina LaAM-08-1 TaxID=1095629 RepID=A0A0C9YI75_9AGAR|nr:hypothetical protein K443DRAFT_149932 [Laccaria amethystina LaAM-08-1]
MGLAMEQCPQSEPRKRLDNLTKDLITSSSRPQADPSRLDPTTGPLPQQKRRPSSQLHNYKRTRGQTAGDVSGPYARPGQDIDTFSKNNPNMSQVQRIGCLSPTCYSYSERRLECP